jgi:trehalose/maltose transport system substrate-binding protein
VKHRALLAVTGSIGAVALLVSLTIAAAGSASTAAGGKSTAATITPPSVPGAAAIKAKYGGTSITFFGDSANAGLSHKRDVNLVAQFSKQTGVKVKLVQKPINSTDDFAQLARTFSAHSSAYDVMMMDVVWPASFAPYLVDLKPALGKQAKLHQAGIVQGFTIGGKLVAMPWFSDFGILYYRKDLLKKYGYSKPPTTWAQLGAMAKKIQDGEQATNPNFYGFVYQGNAYEGLVCDSLEWLASSGGGHFIDGGKVTINNPKAAAMLNLQRSWVGKITPRGVTTYTETESNNAFDSGNAAFLRNWPYGYSTGQAAPDIKGKFDVTVLPHSGNNPSVATVGGWALGISKYSKNIGAATEFVRYLSSAAVNRYDAIYSSNVPTIPSIAKLPEVRKVNPWLKPEIATVARVSRPTSLATKYQQGIKVIYQGVNQILNGTDAKSVLPRMQAQLNRLVK